MKTFGPYSPIIKAGELYFVAGHIGVDPTTGDASPDVAEQTSQAMKNMINTLASHNLDTDNIVKTTLYVTDMEDFSIINEVYEGFFAHPRPARATIAVQELPRVAKNRIRVEIEAVAHMIKRTEAEEKS